jgi:phosphate transport system substrate-binding protein
MRNRRPNQLLFAVALCGFGAFSASAAEMPSYEPRAVEFPTNASYVQPDGSIYIVGNDGMEAILKQFNDLFAKTHPGFRFKMLLKGSSTGIGGLTAGVSAFAPMGPGSLGHGRKRIPRGLRFSALRHPHRLRRLRARQAQESAGDLREREKSARRPHARGAHAGLHQRAPEGRRYALEATRLGRRMGEARAAGLWPTRRWRLGNVDPPYQARRTSLRVRLQRAGKALRCREGCRRGSVRHRLGEFLRRANVSSNVRLLPLAGKTGEPFVGPSYEDIRAGRYPLAVHLRLYAVRAPGKPLDPLVKEYARLVLSKEGQAIIAAQKDSDEGFVPLNASELVAQLAALD